MGEKETFEEFKNSFFYGKRSDMSFKFLEHMEEQEASDFLQSLFRATVDSIDTGDLSVLKNTLIEGQIGGYARQKHFEYEEGPFTPLPKPLAEMKMTLLTSSGHFVEGNDPQPFGIADMSQQEAESRIMEFLKIEPQLTEIPFDSPPDKLRVRHGGYDVRGARQDPSTVFPWKYMTEFAKDGIFGSLTDNCYSFVGACSQKRLINSTLPRWIERMLAQRIDGALLIPV